MFRYETKEYTIRADSMNWILELYPEKKKANAKKASTITKYYGSLQGALNGLFQWKVRNTEDFEDLRKQLPAIKKEILGLLDFKDICS